MLNAIVARLNVILTGFATRRNLNDVELSWDVSSSNRVASDEYALAANNSTQNNAASSVNLGPVIDFIHIQCDNPLLLTITAGSNVYTDKVAKLTIRDGPYDLISITNQSTSRVVNAKVIIA